MYACVCICATLRVEKSSIVRSMERYTDNRDRSKQHSDRVKRIQFRACVCQANCFIFSQHSFLPLTFFESSVYVKPCENLI